MIKIIRSVRWCDTIDFRFGKKLQSLAEENLSRVSSTYPSPSSAISRSAQMGSASPIVISFASTSKPRMADLNRGATNVGESMELLSLVTLRFLVVQHMWQWLGNEIDWENHFLIGPSRDRKGHDVSAKVRQENVVESHQREAVVGSQQIIHGIEMCA